MEVLLNSKGSQRNSFEIKVVSMLYEGNEIMTRVRMVAIALINFISFIPFALGEPFKVSTWNIENLTSKPKVNLVPYPARLRELTDYMSISKILDNLQADIILYQEITSIEALEMVAPIDHQIVFANSVLDNDETFRLFTAISYNPNKARLLTTDTIATRIEFDDFYQGRVSTAVLLNVNGNRIWFVSVHLKSSCSNVTLPDFKKVTDCVILYHQLKKLSAWVQRVSSTVDAVVIGGDYNRRPIANFSEDKYLQLLPDKVGKKSISYPNYRETKCQEFKSSDKEAIDYFITYRNDSVDVSKQWETIFNTQEVEKGAYISNHCPVSMYIQTMGRMKINRPGTSPE